MKSKLMVILRIAISLGMVTFLLWCMRGHFAHIKVTLFRANVTLFSCAVLFFMLNISILSMRLRLLFAGEGLKIPYGRVIQLTYIGYFFNNFMPTAVGGDIIKAYYANKQTGKTAKSVIAVFMDRFIGLFSFIYIAALALFMSWASAQVQLKIIVLSFALGWTVAFLIILHGAVAKVVLGVLSRLKLWTIGEKLSGAYRAAHEYKNKKKIILGVIGISVAAQGTYLFIVYLLARSIGSNVPFISVLLIMPIVAVVSMIPSLGGLGLREGAMVALFGPIIGSENAFSLSVLLLATLLIISLMGAVIYLFASQFKMRDVDVSALSTYNV